MGEPNRLVGVEIMSVELNVGVDYAAAVYFVCYLIDDERPVVPSLFGHIFRPLSRGNAVAVNDAPTVWRPAHAAVRACLRKLPRFATCEIDDVRLKLAAAVR